MTDALNAVLSTPERFALEHATLLANMPVENRHEHLIPELLASWFKAASPTVREALRSSFKRGHETQTTVSTVLGQVQPIEEFAEPLLNSALAAHGWADVNPRTYGLKQVHLLSSLVLFFTQQQLKLVDTLVQLYFPEILIPETLEINIASSITYQSLLQAALQNFEADETVEGGFDTGSSIYAVSGNQQVEQPQLKPEIFARVCRDLNLGMQYQWHLARVFEPADDNLQVDDQNSKAYWLKRLIVENMRNEFICALHMAYMKQEVTVESYAFMLDISGASSSRLTRSYQAHGTLQIMGFEVPGIIVFWPYDMPPAQQQSCVLYIPNSPNRDFHEFESFDLLKATLREWLKHPGFARFFFQRVPLRYRAEFMRRTDVKNMTWDSLLLRRPPIINEPALMAETRYLPQTEDPWMVAWHLQLAQIKDDARLLIVPTEDEDSKSRLARQASFLNLGLSVLTLALGFVPVLGEIMLATSVIQLGFDVYDGIKAWQHDDRAGALEHLFDIAQNIALVAGGSTVARALKPSPIVDALVVVKSVKGQKRLWRPDLEPYHYPNVSLAGLKPDEQGLYNISGKQFIKLEDKVFRIETDEHTQRTYIGHPSDPQAYTPRVRHNGSGAWVHEIDDPLQMSRKQLFRRLGPEAQQFSDKTAEHILAASNTSDDVLRKVLMDNLALPPVLADSMRRVRLSEMVESFIVQMEQGVNRSTDNARVQLQLLTRIEGWPADRVLRVVDMKGATVMEYGPDTESLHPRLQIAQAQIENGDLLKTTLECLSSAQIDTLLGESVAGLEQQVQALSRKLASLARATKPALLLRLYSQGEVVTARMHPLQKQFPGLPANVMAELLDHLSADESVALQSSGRLPLHVLEEARSYVQTLRLNRALEGLYFENLSREDSNTLAWQTLTGLPGWPANLRLVLRDKVTGDVLSSVGNPEAIYSREFFKNAGEYYFYGRDIQDIYSSPYLSRCVAKSLTPAERNSLGLPVAEPAAVLNHKIADLAASQRAQSASALGMHRIKPWFKSPMRLADGRVGYPLSGRKGPVSAAGRSLLLKDLVTELYPLMDEAQAGQFLSALKLSPGLTTRALVKLKAELDTLRSDLEQWVESTVWSQPRNGPQVLMSVRDKRAISQALTQAWRRQTQAVSYAEHTGYVLDLNSWPVDCLPQLTADFSHISALRLSNSPNGHFNGAFLERFPNLRVLSLRNNQLSELPGEIAGMHELIELNLQGNQIVLSGRAASVLSGLSKLKSLNLTGNNLGRRISVRRMVDLEHLHLRDTGLLTWPEGVESLARLQTLDLRDNAISRIPQEVFSPDRAALNRVTHLHDNPLSADSLRRLENYRRETGLSLGVTPRRQHAAQAYGIFHWAPRPTFEQTGIWNDLRGIERSSDFFRVLEDLSTSAQFVHRRENLSQRVWQVLKAIHANTELRDQLFEVSANPNTCADGILMIFADLELRQRIFAAQSAVNAEEELLKLGQGLFRIELLDKHIQGVVDARVAAIHAEHAGYVQQLQDLLDAQGADIAPEPVAGMTPEQQQGIAYRLGTPQGLSLAQRLSPVDLQARLERVEPLEVQMFYQVRLADELGLPARPENMIFERIANVTDTQLQAARQYVLSEDTDAAKIAYIQKQGFWENFLQKKYPEHFRSVDSPLHERMQLLYMARERLSSQEYVSKTQEVGDLRLVNRQELIARLTREEVERHPFAPVQPSTSGTR